jgi:hypothetical protein
MISGCDAAHRYVYGLVLISWATRYRRQEALMVIQSTADPGFRRKPIREFSEIAESATRRDVAVAWALLCAIAVVVLILV